ncbi:leucine--tRNA ligase [Rathayibacter sp. AY1E1]|uniref:leucine--tRNA ligase n=1 Tax=Rathayibacter sp. AY1E1 TaxID=2080549 RepID=UPI0021577EBC|nr:leucine--tRNA ligase [Rathayibacter sp. AY1E1]
MWEERGCFRTPDLDELEGRETYYALDMFPYPSGAGLHVGHPKGYTATDVMARWKRANGVAVLHPMGWDSFGLPAERAAQREGRPPADITAENIANFKRQIKSLGLSYDWSREIATSNPEYYKWTQWIFLRLHERGLAYLEDVLVNWCPALGTVLANEEVKDDKYVETGDLVERRVMKQWMLRITAYADRLLEDLDQLDWPEGLKEMQRNWIGKSRGANVRFKLAEPVDGIEQIAVFTTRPDTLPGVTFMAIAPEHELAGHTSDTNPLFAIHPITGKSVPVLVGEYVLASYGHGAVMGVPAHDERDAQFAEMNNLPIIAVHDAEGTYILDGMNGLDVEQAKSVQIGKLADAGAGEETIAYRLQDWLFSRQRFWGEPFPVVHADDGEIFLVDSQELPVMLPELSDVGEPTSDDGGVTPPLSRSSESWKRVTLPDGRMGTREFNTMPQWAGSCWYYLRFISPKFENGPVQLEAAAKWLPVDLYVGGAEHAVLHLLYARFWHKVLFDIGIVTTPEPFQKLVNQGMVQARSYKRPDGRYVRPENVENRDGDYFDLTDGTPIETTRIEKMSKSKFNVVSPDDVVRQYGADTLRLYELFMGPLTASAPWDKEGITGVSRFLARVAHLFLDEGGERASNVINSDQPASRQTEVALNVCITVVDESIQSVEKMNTGIAGLMTCLKNLRSAGTVSVHDAYVYLRLLNPFAPHIAEEIWTRIGDGTMLATAEWPRSTGTSIDVQMISLPVQVNGKFIKAITVHPDQSQAEALEAARSDQQIARLLGDSSPTRVIHVPNRFLNVMR